MCIRENLSAHDFRWRDPHFGLRNSTQVVDVKANKFLPESVTELLDGPPQRWKRGGQTRARYASSTTGLQREPGSGTSGTLTVGLSSSSGPEWKTRS
jgi:hypothetical protein